MQPAKKIIGKVKRGVQNIAYGNPLYHKMLSAGTSPTRLHFTPPDLWPGDAQMGLAMISAQRPLFDTLGQSAESANYGVPTFDLADQLRNLRAVGTDVARHAALRLIRDGMANCETWNDQDWLPEFLGARTTAWISFYEFYAPAATPEFLDRLTASLHRQWKHLARVAPSSSFSSAGFDIIAGLIYGELNFATDDQGNGLGLACDRLKRQLAEEILPDGTHISRNPSIQLRILQRLLDLRAAFLAAGLPWPNEAAMAISTMAPVLKFYRHGDGALALFHGSRQETSLIIDAALTQAESKGRMPRRLTHGGYERVTAGRSLLIADCGCPPATGHAGIFSFEFGQGKERLIVNCGTHHPDSRDSTAAKAWARAMASTAAHSTLTVADTNACDVGSEGGVRTTAHCTSHRYEEAGGQGIEMYHNGYVAPFGIGHQRILELSGDGDELRGRDILEGNGDRSTNAVSFALRWHLHPSVKVALAQNGQTALLRTASGAGWRLRVEDAALTLEAGVYCGTGTPRRTQQLKTTGTIGGRLTDGHKTTVRWALSREKK